MQGERQDHFLWLLKQTLQSSSHPHLKPHEGESKRYLPTEFRYIRDKKVGFKTAKIIIKVWREVKR